MKLRGVPVSGLLEAIGRLWMAQGGRVTALVAEADGRDRLTADERRLALGTDGALRRLRVRCLRRSVVVTEMLRRRGVAARIRLSVAAASPEEAHAEVEVGGRPLRPAPPGWVVLR